MALGHPDTGERRVSGSSEDLGPGHSLLPGRVGELSGRGAEEGRRQLRWGRWRQLGGGGQPCLQAAPSPSRRPAAERPAPQPLTSRGRKPGAPTRPLGGLLPRAGRGTGCAPARLPPSRMVTPRGALGTRDAQPVLRGPGGPRSPAQGPWGRGRAGGWGGGGDRDFALCLSLSLPLCRATGRNPTPSTSQAAGVGQAPPPGFFSKSRPDLPAARAVTEVVLWGEGASRP